MFSLFKSEKKNNDILNTQTGQNNVFEVVADVKIEYWEILGTYTLSLYIKYRLKGSSGEFVEKRYNIVESLRKATLVKEGKKFMNYIDENVNHFATRAITCDYATLKEEAEFEEFASLISSTKEKRFEIIISEGLEV